MKITANRAALLEAFNAVAGVIPSRSPKPILQNVKIIASEAETTLLATDLDIGIRRTVAFVTVDEPGEAILSERVGQILKLSRDVYVSIETDGDKLHVKGDRASWDLPSEDPDLFPNVPNFETDDYFKVRDSDLARAIRQTIFATDTDSTRYALGGTLWEFDQNIMTAVGTCGRRLACCKIDYEPNNKPGTFTNNTTSAKLTTAATSVPVKALKLIAKSIGDDGNEIHISVGANSFVLIRTEDTVIYTRVVEGRFPRYQDVFPERPPYSLDIPAKDLLVGVAQASILTSEDSRGVDFNFNHQELNLSAQSADRGSAKISVPMAGDGVSFGITFDPEYLSTMLRAIPEESNVRIRLTDGKTGAQFDVEPDYQYVIMPLTRDR